MQALENTGRRSWVKTYPLCPSARMDEQNHQVQSRNGVIRLLGWNQYPQTSTAAANNRRNDRKCVQARGNSHMRRLKLLPLLSISSLALLVSGCGGGNSIGHTTQTVTFANPGTQTVGVPLTLSSEASSDAAVTLTSATPAVCTVSGTTATFVTAGTCTIDASQSGNSTYAAASQVAQSFTVNPAISPNTTIYITGYALTANSAGGPGNNLPEIWKLISSSPTATATALSMPSGMTSSYAYGIAISGSDVYVAGTASNGTNDTAVYWLNGAATILPSSMTISGAGAIAVSGGNVYVTGFEENIAGNSTAVLWVNGVATTLAPPSGKAYSSAGTIVVSGSDVYVTGIASNTDSDEVAVLWVNGTATLLPAPNGFTGDYWADGIAVSGGNVYVSGTTSPDVGSYTAIYWANNGAPTTLPMPPADFGNYGTNAIAVSGGDVYVSGSGVPSATGNTTAAYWLNGTATSLPLPTNTISSPATSFAAGIGFSGSDVYMVGSAGQTAAYWVNGGAGTLLPLPSGTYESGASAIAVATQ
jgi:hypothetical protein